MRVAHLAQPVNCTHRVLAGPSTPPSARVDGPEAKDLFGRLRQTGERPCTLRRAAVVDLDDDSEEAELLQLLEGGNEPDENATLPAEILNDQEVVNRLYSVVHEHAAKHYHAFFSSELGGITTAPALMSVHLDDHMVHRGHAVFDTVHLIEGSLYLFDRHINRFVQSAEKAELRLPCSVPQLKRIILETVAASKKLDGFVRFWLGGGRGGFGISPSECERASFYCVVTTLPEGSATLAPGSDYLRGRRVKTTSVPIKHPFFAGVKSNNYLANVLTVVDAEKDGYDYGIFVDEDGYYAEAATANIGIVTKAGELVVPPFDHSLPGITVQRLLELLHTHIDSVNKDTKGLLRTIVRRKFNFQDVYEAQEVILIGSTAYVTAIVRWDSVDKGDGPYGDEPGIVSLVLRTLLKNDIDPVQGPPENFTEVPYGILTNMQD